MESLGVPPPGSRWHREDPILPCLSESPPGPVLRNLRTETLAKLASHLKTTGKPTNPPNFESAGQPKAEDTHNRVPQPRLLRHKHQPLVWKGPQVTLQKTPGLVHLIEASRSGLWV